MTNDDIPVDELAGLLSKLTAKLRERPRRDQLSSHALKDTCRCRHRRAEHSANRGRCLVQGCSCWGFHYRHLMVVR